MATVNVGNLVNLARAVETGVRVVETGIKVSQDPPVQKAQDQFLDDLDKTRRSASSLAGEVRQSWRRHWAA